MPWAKPFDAEGRLFGGAMVLTLGGDPGATPAVPGVSIAITSFTRSSSPEEITAVDSGDWDPVDKTAYGTSMTTSIPTTGTIEGFVRLSQTPDEVFDHLYTGADVPFAFKPDGTTTMLSGLLKITSIEDTYPAEDWCTFSIDYRVQGKPTRAGNIAIPA